MSKRFHRGLTSYLRTLSRNAGLAIDESDAQKTLAGLPISLNTEVNNWTDNYKAMVLSAESKRNIMRQWEEDHPDDDPFPPSFPERIMEIINGADPEDFTDAWAQIESLTRKEVTNNNWYDGD